MDKRLEKGEATRQRLVAVATRLFATHGYDAVSIDQVRVAAQISRGALFHHFPSKDALFLAVLETTESRVAEHMRASAARATSPIAALKAGIAGWLELAASDAEVQRIVLTDAPAVVGWNTWREIDARYGLGLLQTALSAAGISADRINLTSRCLLAILVELALVIASSPSDSSTAAQASDFANEALEKLFVPSH